MARCPHNRIQQFTEMCLDCGRNIYESDEDYLRHLRARAGESEIEKLEKQLGIKHPGNSSFSSKRETYESDDWYPNKYPDM